MAQFVLLHGTTQSPIGWLRLVKALEGLGHTTHCPDLPSSDLSGPEYAALVDQQRPPVEQDVVVVTHSGAGLLLPAVAERLRAIHRVWLAAVIPHPRVSFMEEVSAAPEQVLDLKWIGCDPTSDSDLAAYFLFHDCDDATLRWALTTLRQFVPRRLYDERVPMSMAIRSSAIVPTGDRTLRPSWMSTAARERLGVVATEIDGGHCPHVASADAVASLLDQTVNLNK